MLIKPCPRVHIITKVNFANEDHLGKQPLCQTIHLLFGSMVKAWDSCCGIHGGKRVAVKKKKIFGEGSLNDKKPFLPSFQIPWLTLDYGCHGDLSWCLPPARTPPYSLMRYSDFPSLVDMQLPFRDLRVLLSVVSHVLL